MVSISMDDKNAMTELNNRFLHYVNRVRQLKDENDIRVINQNIIILEEELKTLKVSYESQISQLKTTLDMIMTQKIDLEKELLAKKASESHLNDRLSVETSKNGKLLHELGCLRSDMSSKEQEIVTLNLSIKHMRLESVDAAETCNKLKREVEEYRLKIEEYEIKIRDSENEISSLKQKIEFQDQYFNKNMKNMQTKLDEYLTKMVEMDYRVEEAKRKEDEWPGILERIQATAKDEYEHVKRDIEENLNATISHLQRQLEIEAGDSRQLKENNESMNKSVLQLRKKESELMSQVADLRRQNEILETIIKSDKEESEKVILSLQSKMKSLQDQFLSEIKLMRSGQFESLTIHGEIEFLRRLLDEEEKRLNIKGIESKKAEEEMVLTKEFKNGNGKTENVVSVEDNVNEHLEDVSEEENKQLESKIDGCEESFIFGGRYRKETGDNAQVMGYSSGLLNVSNTVGPIMHSKLTGPICHTEQIQTQEQYKQQEQEQEQEHDQQQQQQQQHNLNRLSQGRPASANIRGIRTAVNDQNCYQIQQQEEDMDSNVETGNNSAINGSCQSNALLNRADSGLGQSPDYMDSVFRAKGQSRQLKCAGESISSSVSLTGLNVLEVNKDGKYVKICNSNEDQDAEIGGFMIKQNRFGHPVAMFRFPDRLKLPAKGTINLWAGSTDPLLHQPPTDFYCPEPLQWGSTPEYVTILCNASGQAISWTTPTHRINPDPFRAQTAPSSRRSTASEPRKAGDQKLPELISAKMTTPQNEHLYVTELYNEDSLIRQSIQYPYTSTPKTTKNSQCNSHPCQESQRGKVLGNDNSSFNRQARQILDGVPDMMISQPYAGTNSQRAIGSARVLNYYPAPVIQKSHSFNNRTTDVLLRSNTEPPNVFQKPQARFLGGLEQIQSMHNAAFSAPMYRPLN